MNSDFHVFPILWTHISETRNLKIRNVNSHFQIFKFQKPEIWKHKKLNSDPNSFWFLVYEIWKAENLNSHFQISNFRFDCKCAENGNLQIWKSEIIFSGFLVSYFRNPISENLKNEFWFSGFQVLDLYVWKFEKYEFRFSGFQISGVRNLKNLKTWNRIFRFSDFQISCFQKSFWICRNLKTWKSEFIFSNFQIFKFHDLRFQKPEIWKFEFIFSNF